MPTKSTALEYGEYQKMYNDPRTRSALSTINKLAEKMDIKHNIIGGFAAYMHAKNPPEDFPDIDILLYEEVDRAQPFIEQLELKPKFHLLFLEIPEERDILFSTLSYDKFLQIDIFTSLDERQPRKPKRIEGWNIEPVEPLIVEKLVRGTREDVLMAMDLLAFVDYDKPLLSRIAAEYKATGMLQHAAYFARRMAVGRLSKVGLKRVVDRLVKNQS